MLKLNKIFFNKKILIYGLGLSGKSSFNYLKKNNKINVYDDDILYSKQTRYKKYFIKKKKISKYSFDHIVMSPGINFKKCNLKNYLNKHKNKICTDFDIFYANNPKNKLITVTGTNGKSTTVKLISEILNNAGIDARSVGNIGKSILNETNIKKNTFLVIEASSYQIEYSNFFRSKYSLILNINADHLDRHGSFSNYLQAKLKLFYNQSKDDYAFFEKKNLKIHNSIKKQKLKSKICNVNQSINYKYDNYINNSYFYNRNNKQNLSFVFAICELLKIKKKIIIKTINNFKPLKYRQQIIYNSKKLIIINDSKSTSFSSTINMIKSDNNIFWILGGKPKKKDKFNYKKNKSQNIQAYIFGKNKNFFTKNLKKKIKYEVFLSIKSAFEQAFIDVKKSKIDGKKLILFSPSSASFDQFNNFEERGAYFNSLVKSKKIKL
tara:strand:+ start:762 stop:2069 length:1308 start_codon:yes stop_codon:yes gene_type:complete